MGSRITTVDGVSYGAFLVPGLTMLMLLTQSVSNAVFAIYFPNFIGTIYEILSAPVSFFEVVLGYVGAAATKSVILGAIIISTASLFVPLQIMHPLWMVFFLVATAVIFSLLGFIIGIRWNFYGVADVSVALSVGVGHHYMPRTGCNVSGTDSI